MSIDLKFYPFHRNFNSEPKQKPFSTIGIDVGSNLGIYDALMELSQKKGKKVKKFSCHEAVIPDGECEGERCYGDVTEDDGGQKLRMLTAKQLTEFFTEHYAQIVADERPRAAFAYVNALPPERYVLLYWC